MLKPRSINVRAIGFLLLAKLFSHKALILLVGVSYSDTMFVLSFLLEVLRSHKVIFSVAARNLSMTTGRYEGSGVVW